MNIKHRIGSSFSTKMGIIMAAAGSAVGLGNLWKFPYVAGENGGAAFLLVYLVCVLVFGLPLLSTEFLLGQRSGKSAYGAFRELSGNNRWQWLGWMCFIAVFVLMGFYFVVAGWCVNYLFEAVMHTYAGLDTEGLNTHFASLISNTPRMIAFSLLPLALTAVVLLLGVQKGIERLSKVLMPMLLIMMVLMVCRVLMLNNSDAGLRFFFRTDFSQITPKVVMEAVGQSFFSLSVGVGALITYGAYMPKQQDVTSASLQVIVLDTLVAVLAGVIVFPAVFAFGFDPAEGPELVFVVLPAVLEQMSFAWLSGVLFFLLLFVAAITSTISMMEIAVAFLCEASSDSAKDGKAKKGLSRHQSVLIVTAVVAVLMTLCVLSMTGKADWLTVFGLNLFDCFDRLVTLYFMPINALSMSLFVGWFMPKHYLDSNPHADLGYKRLLRPVYLFAVRWIVPIAIVIIFFNGLGIVKW
ncbi:MAG: sodium-dependent transporter [Paludibacteraceae bacterium]|nr:sodium-dependent transporter [Paludibacteraceae bacterium]